MFLPYPQNNPGTDTLLVHTPGHYLSDKEIQSGK